MNTKSAIWIALLGILIAVGTSFWGCGDTQRADSESQAPAARNAGATPAASPAPLAIDWKQEGPRIYGERHPDPVGAQLLVLYPNDKTGLRASWCPEISDTMNTLLANWVALGGRPMTTADPRNVERMVNRHKLPSTGVDDLPLSAALAVGRQMNSLFVVQLTTDRPDAASTRARARLVDVSAGTSAGEWTVSVDEPDATYETLYDVQVALAPDIAARICDMESSAALLAAVRARAAAADDVEKTEAALAEARELLLMPTQPRLHRALRLAGSVAEQYPATVEAWTLLTLGHAFLSGQFEGSQTPAWERERVRALTASATAYAISPDDPYARYARTCGINATGRVAQAMHMTRRFAEERPGDAITSASCAVMWMDPAIFPAEDASTSARDRAYLRLLRRELDAKLQAGGFQKLRDEVMQAEPFAPYHWLASGSSWNSDGRLGQARLAAAVTCVQGGLMGVSEALRVYERAGRHEEAGAIVAELAKVGFPQLQPTADARAAGAPLSEALQARLRRLTADQVAGAGREFMNIEPDSETGRVIALGCAEVAKARAIVVPAPGVRAAGMPVLLEGEAALDAGIRFAADGGAEIIRRIGVDWSVPELAEAAIAFFEKHLPHDLAVLDGITDNHRSGKFNNVLVDQYQGKIRAVNTGYLPMLRRNAGFAAGSTEDRRKVLESLLYHSPFHYTTLAFIAGQLEQIGDYATAARYHDLLAARYPLYLEARRDALKCRAKAEGRPLTADEANAMIASLVGDEESRERIAWRTCWDAGMVPECIAHLEKWMTMAEPTDYNTFALLARLHRLNGDRAKGDEALIRFLDTDPGSMEACEAWLAISFSKSARGDHDGAVAALRGAQAVDNWKGDVIMRNAFLLLRSGNHHEAAKEYMRADERYGGGGIGYAVLALMEIGEEAELLPKLEQALAKEWPKEDSFAAKAALLRRKGDNAAAAAAAEGWNRWMSGEPKAALMAARHYEVVGDLAKAEYWAEEAVRRTANKRWESAYYVAGLIAERQGKLGRARELAGIITARNPMNKEEHIILARLALRAGDADGALRELRTPLLLDMTDAHTAAAEAWLAKGDPQRAYDHAKIAMTDRSFDNWTAPVVMARVASALGKAEEAKVAADICRGFGPETEPARRVKELNL